MKIIKKLLPLALILLLCASLAACGGDEPEAGDDWRTTGIVIGSGTITHDGESVDVLVTISESSAAFYRDSSEQVLFDSVAFPMTITDAKTAFVEISFDDLSGDGESDVRILFNHENGDRTELVWIWDSVERYVFSDELSSVSAGSEPYFSRQGLGINASLDDGEYTLTNGVCSYINLGEGYSVGDCSWELIKKADNTHDGIREIEFDAVCRIPESAVPSYDGQYVLSTNSELYDFYTGMWLTAASSYTQTDKGENQYVHTVEWNGESYQIEFAYSTEWDYDASGYNAVFTKSYIVYLPEGYDGLVFAAEPQQDNYRDCAKFAQLDSISPEACIMDIDMVDTAGTLFFSVCY